MRMKKLLLGTSVFAGLSLASAALAADMPLKAPREAPYFSWSGGYIGAFAGGAWADRDVSTTDPCLVNTVCTTKGNYNGVGPAIYDLKNSFIAGVTTGFNAQSGAFVFGIESESGYIHLRGSSLFPGAPVGGDTSAFTEVGDWYYVLAGRVGVAFDRTLLYAKAGGVGTRVTTAVVDTCSVSPCGPATVNTRTRGTIFGLAAGGGIDYAFSHAWSIKAEYLFLGIEQSITHVAATSPGPVVFSVTQVPGVHTAKIGLNYRFSGFGGPFAAQY